MTVINFLFPEPCDSRALGSWCTGPHVSLSTKHLHGFLVLYLYICFSEETKYSVCVGKCTKGRIWPAVTHLNLQGGGEFLGNLVPHFNLVLPVPGKGWEHRTRWPRDHRTPGLTPRTITRCPGSCCHHQAGGGGHVTKSLWHTHVSTFTSTKQSWHDAQKELTR